MGRLNLHNWVDPYSKKDLRKFYELYMDTFKNKIAEVDSEYLITLIKQIRCKNNGIKSHLNKKGFQEKPGLMINGDHLSFDYLLEKTKAIDMLLDTIAKDILKKSGRFRKLEN